ncbi:MAG: hypothetical protein ACPGJS_11590 [Flammeovirgaceae bacterium]
MQNYFLKMLHHLHRHEEVLIFTNQLNLTPFQQQEVITYLQLFYESESLNYPYEAPAFDADAALWAAHTVYIACQLILYRENKEADLVQLLPHYPNDISASAILSADVCLRFMPDLISQIAAIDPADALIQLLEVHLTAWHYSGINYALDLDQLSFTSIQENPCLMQLYTDRIIQFKNQSLAQHAVFNTAVRANLGLFADQLWNDLELGIA